MYVQAAMAAAQIGSSIMGAKKTNKAAKKAAREQAAMAKFQRDEEDRQRVRGAKVQSAEAKARVYGSNLQYGGSSRRYVQDLDMENMREIAFARDAAQQEQNAIRAGAKGAGDSLYYKAAGDAIGAAANIYASNYTSSAPDLNTQGVVDSPAANYRAPATIGDPYEAP